MKGKMKSCGSGDIRAESVFIKSVFTKSVFTKGIFTKRVFTKGIFIIAWVIVACMWSGLMCGCSVKNVAREKIKDIEFTVMREEDIPKELKSTIDAKLDKGFMLTYQDEEYLYIAKGYGQMEGGSYCITVEDMYLTKNTVCVQFMIRGSKDNESVSTDESQASIEVTTPYIVIKCENPNKPVIFK